MATILRARRPALTREVARNLGRRKLRSALTLAGIALGAFALMVMGSLAENFNTSIGALREFLSEQVLVRPKGSNVFFSNGHLPASMLATLEGIEGVEVVVPRVSVLFDEDANAAFGPPQILAGVDVERAARSPLSDLKLVAGRRLAPGDRWKVVLGAELARRFRFGDRFARPGDRVRIRGHRFEVVGVAAATGTPVDRLAATSIEDTRAILKETDPFVDAAAVVDEYSVYPKAGVDPDDLARRIAAATTGTVIFPPSASDQQLRQLTAIWNAIILGSALVALIVGGVAIINTMVFSVTERVREIGIKKAVGASSRDILREFLAESALLSFAGGLVGGAGGAAFAWALNAVSRGSGVVAFTVTPRLAGFVFALSAVVGVGAGLLPARRAARVDPVRALRTLG